MPENKIKPKITKSGLRLLLLKLLFLCENRIVRITAGKLLNASLNGIFRCLPVCIAIAVIVGIWFRGGLIIVPFMVFAIYPLVKALFGNPIIPQSRVGAMAQICSLNIALGAFYVAGIMACNVCLAL